MAQQKIASFINVQKALKGIHYPAKKNDLLERAKANKADKELISLIESLKKDEFKNPAEVSKAVGEAG